MSRVGKVPVSLTQGAKVEISGLNIKVHGTKGTLEKKFAGDIMIEQTGEAVVVKPLNDTTAAKAMWGTARSIINSMVKGVTVGFSEEMEVNGVGYRAAIKGKYLNLTLGKSHNTLQITSPPTFCFLASLSDITPLDVDRICMPILLK